MSLAENMVVGVNVSTLDQHKPEDSIVGRLTIHNVYFKFLKIPIDEPKHEELVQAKSCLEMKYA